MGGLSLHSQVHSGSARKVLAQIIRTDRKRKQNIHYPKTISPVIEAGQGDGQPLTHCVSLFGSEISFRRSKPLETHEDGTVVLFALPTDMQLTADCQRVLVITGNVPVSLACFDSTERDLPVTHTS